MKRTTTRRTTVLGTATLAATLFAAAPAAAVEQSECDGVVSGQTFTGNVVVPAGGSCLLASSTVNGNVVVGEDADLTLSSATVTGVVRQQPRSFVAATKSTLGNLGTARGYGAQLTDTTVKGNLSAYARFEAPGAEPSVFLTRSTLGGLRGEELILSSEASRLGTVQLTRAVDDIILQSSTAGSASIDFTGSVSLCGSTFTGPVAFYYAENLISGDSSASCTGNRFNSSLSVRLATGNVAFYGNTVNGSAHAEGVTALQQGRNTFKGNVSGQFTKPRATTSVQGTTANRPSWGSTARRSVAGRSTLIRRATGKAVTSQQQKSLRTRAAVLSTRARAALAEARAHGSVRL